MREKLQRKRQQQVGLVFEDYHLRVCFNYNHIEIHSIDYHLPWKVLSILKRSYIIFFSWIPLLTYLLYCNRIYKDFQNPVTEAEIPETLCMINESSDALVGWENYLCVYC